MFKFNSWTGNVHCLAKKVYDEAESLIACLSHENCEFINNEVLEILMTERLNWIFFKWFLESFLGVLWVQDAWQNVHVNLWKLFSNETFWYLEGFNQKCGCTNAGNFPCGCQSLSKNFQLDCEVIPWTLMIGNTWKMLMLMIVVWP